MTRYLVIFLTVLVAMAAAMPCQAQMVTLVNHGGGGVYAVTFDSARISKAEMKRLLILSPYTDDFVSTVWSLETCVPGDPRYNACGSGDLADPNFFRNARINLGIAKQNLAYLEKMSYPKQLAPVVTYEKWFSSFTLWEEQTRLAFYQTWNIKVLKTTHDGLDATGLCSAALDQIRAARSNREKYSLALSGWGYCMLGGFEAKWGSYPADAWGRFLKDYGIKARFSDDVYDDSDGLFP